MDILLQPIVMEYLQPVIQNIIMVLFIAVLCLVSRFIHSATQRAKEQTDNQIESIGINADISTPEDTELMYLKKQAYILKRDKDDDYKKVITGIEKGSKKDQIKALKDYWSKELGEDITKRKEYNPFGGYQNGAGNRLQYRFDIKDDEFKKEMGDYVIGHELTNDYDIVKFIDMVLENNGAMISTKEKIRLGIPVGGKSPIDDMRTGGASYFFTRIRKKNKPLQLNFKIDLLKRMDAISYAHDYYGEVIGEHVFEKRNSTPVEWKNIAGFSDNETMFKDTVTLIDNLDTIVVADKYDKESLINVFKKHNINKLPDGRLIKNIIKVEK